MFQFKQGDVYNIGDPQQISLKFSNNDLLYHGGIQQTKFNSLYAFILNPRFIVKQIKRVEKPLIDYVLVYQKIIKQTFLIACQRKMAPFNVCNYPRFSFQLDFIFKMKKIPYTSCLLNQYLSMKMSLCLLFHWFNKQKFYSIIASEYLLHLCDNILSTFDSSLRTV